MQGDVWRWEVGEILSAPLALTSKGLSQGTLPLQARILSHPSNPPLTHLLGLISLWLSCQCALLPDSRCTAPHPPSPFSGTNSQGILLGFNKTVLRTLPRSRNLIVVESVLMAVAFLAMLLVRPGVGVWRGQVWGPWWGERRLRPVWSQG